VAVSFIGGGSHRQILSHLILIKIRANKIHMITTTTAPQNNIRKRGNFIAILGMDIS